VLSDRKLKKGGITSFILQKVELKFYILSLIVFTIKHSIVDKKGTDQLVGSFLYVVIKHKR
jgi:hypothetical protein